MNTLTWKKNTVFNRYEYWHAGFNEHTSRVVFQIDKTNEQYPYRLTIDGNYQGDFKTLRSAKEFSNDHLNTWILDVRKKAGIDQ